MTRDRPDITHSNSLFFDPEEDVFYYHARNLNTFYKIDHKTGQVLWGLGEYGNFTLFDRSGKQRRALFYHAHAVEKVDDNTFILFDNDFHNQTNPNNERSRILEITINETTMTANESWAWTAPPAYYCCALGDADRLPNGNRLGTFGLTRHPKSGLRLPRLVEVNDAGQIVWELNIPSTDEFRYSVGQMERFRFSPILSSPPDIQLFSQENVTVRWQTWYNCRTNRRMLGSYTLYLDGDPIETGTHMFDKFWRPTNLTVNLGKLEVGDYNLTLALADEAGHITTDSRNISIKSFYLEREGPVTIELGQENALLYWKGSTSRPLLATLTINDTQFASFMWNGSVITLDLNSFKVGMYLVTLQLVDHTGIIHEDGLLVTIYPAAAPTIHSFPAAQSFTWNTSLVLCWELFDHTPASWSILVNETLTASGPWETPSYQLNWNVPVMDEGSYNITLAANDLVGHRTSRTTWLTVVRPSPPVIATAPQQPEFQWGQEHALLSWEVHGGTHWTLWKNGTATYGGGVARTRIEVRIENWQLDDWRPGTYNLTLQVTDKSGASATHTSWIRIKQGDVYANSVITEASMWYWDGEYALGSPDDEFATVYTDYEEGYLTLDMGAGEDIVDRSGMDFTVVAQGGRYTTWVSPSLYKPFKRFDAGSGDQSFDLAAVGLFNARYVRIRFFSGEDVEIDAIVATNYIDGDSDNENPRISGPEDFWIWENQTLITLTWRTFDATPWNYSVLTNGDLSNSGLWDGTDITFEFSWSTIDEVQVTLILYDGFGNRAEDSVTIESRSNPSTSTTAPTILTIAEMNYPVLTLLLGIAVALVWRRPILRRR